VTGQSRPSPEKPAAAKTTPSKTPDGQPDVQGYWTNATYTPLERPNNVTKEFWTDAEYQALVKKAAETEEEQTVPGTVADVHYDGRQFARDKRRPPFAKTLRTSLSGAPPTGKLPPLSEEGRKRGEEAAADRKRRGATTDAVQNMPVGSRCLIMAGSGPPMMN